MKNAAIPHQGTAAVSEPWREALRWSAADLRRRGAAERTRRAYGTDAAELAAWATANGLDPERVDYQALRRWAARLSQQGAAPRTMPRKRASLRSLFRSLVEHGRIDANPADLVPAPRLPQTLPRTLKPDDVARLLNRISASTPLGERDRGAVALARGAPPAAQPLPRLDAAGAARPGAVRAGLRVRPAGRGAGRPRPGLRRLRRRAGARGGQGLQDPVRAHRRAGAAGARRLPGP